uniref:Uncharacterized protein n=1 Tax=Triticum urartu TaxID=4572 RepID=A0A8R7PNY0_TRIUA
MDFDASDVPFATRVESNFGDHFGSEFAHELVDLVQARHQEKPKIFVECSESLIVDVLNCVLQSSFLANIHASVEVFGSENHSLSKFSFGNKSVSIQSAIPNTKSARFDDIPGK